MSTVDRQKLPVLLVAIVCLQQKRGLENNIGTCVYFLKLSLYCEEFCKTLFGTHADSFVKCHIGTPY